MKTIVVASGKGGTGKTTLTAAFAHLAARACQCVVADADVEASNLPIALGPRGQECSAFTGGSKALIDRSGCSTCGMCEGACRFGAIVPGFGTYSVDSLSCEGCGSCVRVCPQSAITMVAQTVGEVCSGHSVVGPIVFGQLRPGQDLSGRLVTDVRRLAATHAETYAAELLLIDGPPGIGCPLIAAVTNTDLLVAVAEPSVSGAHDLKRLAQLARRLTIPVGVVLNKSDLSDKGARQIREVCLAYSLPLLGEVPFDPVVAGMLEGMARAQAAPEATTPAMEAIAGAWGGVLDMVAGER